MIHRSKINHARTKVAFNFEVCIDIGDGRKGTFRINEKSDPLLCAL
jgi:hypothetical protein